MIVETYQLENYNCSQIHNWIRLQTFSSYFIKCESVNDNTIDIFFTKTLAGVDKQELDNYMNPLNYSPDELISEYSMTEKRAEDGFNLYKKIYSDVSINNSFPTVDSSIEGYEVLVKIRCMLKDGSGKSALRFLIKHIQPLDIFPVDQTERFRLWIRDYCWEHRVAAYQGLDRASYDEVLDAVETALTI